MSGYDSTQETLKHIRYVQALLLEATSILGQRAIEHDMSKLVDPEKAMFDRFTPVLRQTEYGSPEYHRILTEMRQTALAHHYQCNDHHPEHYPNGITDMSLFSLLEMLCDWQTAGKRHESGNIYKSLEVNTRRFSISPELERILRKTVQEFGWS
jgi:hypothetical protein